MPDQRSVMKEFRFLDAKRIAEGLTPVEEQRYAQLRDLVGPEMGAGGLRSGFDVNAAAARLRDSLLPAGLRNRPPPPPPPEPAPEPEPPPAEDPAADVLASAYAAEPFAPLEPQPQQDAFFDPTTLAQDPGTVQEPAWDAGQPPDPGQGYGAGAAYDPNAPYDPGAPPYDPNAAAYDPSAAAYDPSAAAYDPSAAAYDPSAFAADPNAAAYDPDAPPSDPTAAPYDPNVQPFDAAQGYDPGAQPAWDPNASYDPGAPPFDPNAAAYDPSAQPYETTRQPYDPNQPAWDPNATYDAAGQGYDPATQAYDAGAPLDPAAQPYGAAEQPWSEPTEPGAGAPGYGEPLSDAQGAPLEGDVLAEPASEAAPLDADPSPLPPHGWNVEPPLPEPVESPVLGEYDETGPAAPPVEDAGLESMLPFDPAAESAIEPGDVPEGYGRATGEYDDTAGFAGAAFAEASADLSADGSGFQAAQEVAPEVAPGWQPDVEDGFQLASGGSFDAAAEAAAPEWAGGTAAPPWEDAPQAPPAGDVGAEEAVLEVIEIDAGAADGSQPEPTLEYAQPETTLDFPQPDLSAGIPAEDNAAFAAAPADEASLPHLETELAPAEGAIAVEPAPESQAPPFDVMPVMPEAASEVAAPEPPVEAAPPVASEEEIPIIDGAEILEEISPEETAVGPATPPPAEPAVAAEAAPEVVEEPAVPQPPAPALAPPEPQPEPQPEPPPAAGRRVPGAHRVVVHTVEGQVKRGILEDADLGARSLALSTQQGGAPDLVVATEKVKAIFFMLSPGERAPAPEGKKVRVTFRDGRQVAGFSPDYDESGVGFFMIPGDTRTNTGRIWVYRTSVRQVAVT